MHPRKMGFDKLNPAAGHHFSRKDTIHVLRTLG
jgi:hypothetical protein